MKIILWLTLALAAATASASPISVCPPSFTTDSIEVTPGCPGLAYLIVVTPGTFLAAFNDNPLSEGIASNGQTFDGDDNDAWITGTIVPTGSPLFDAVYITWGGSLSAWTNAIQVGAAVSDAAHPGTEFAGFFIAGTILPIEGWTNNGGSGPPSEYSNFPNLNPGGVDHFFETQDVSTPEPASIWLVASVLALVLCAKARQNIRERRMP